MPTHLLPLPTQLHDGMGKPSKQCGSDRLAIRDSTEEDPKMARTFRWSEKCTDTRLGLSNELIQDFGTVDDLRSA